MPRVRVEPQGYEFEGSRGETVMDAAAAGGYYWPQGCPARGECTNCAMSVISGHARLSRMGRYERANLIRQRGPRGADDPRLRLACQARLEGDIVVEKRGVEPVDILGGEPCRT
jgi:2Fe-2S ferredoxin